MTFRRHSKGTPLATQGGVTLAELLVVLLIWGLIAAVALPMWSRLSRREAVSVAARQIASMVRLAREKAVISGQGSALVYDLNESALHVEWQDGQLRSIRRALPDGVRFKGVEVGNSVVQERSTIALAFTPAGSTMGHVVVLASPDGRAAEVVVEPLTCTARIRLLGKGQ